MGKLLITLTGKTCSGKNYLYEQVVEKHNLNRLVTCTSRSPREGEVEGIDYYFRPENEMKHDYIHTLNFVEAVTIGKYIYGITLEELNSKITEETPAIVILTPDGVEQYRKICANKKITMLSFFIDTPATVRKERFINRFVKELEAKEPLDVLNTMYERCTEMIKRESKWEIPLGAVVLDGLDSDWALETFDFYLRKAKRDLEAVPKGE